jgi:DNA-binding SARP family transcriptional activator/Tfp pilus assembly protein PilF
MGNGLCTLSNGGVVVEFGVLGPVEVWVDGRPADAGHARQRAVLAVLLLEAGRVVPLEVLVDRVWGEDPPRSVRNVVYGYVGRLKTLIAGGSDPGVVLSRQAGGYLLQARMDQVDVHRFRGLTAEAAAAARDDERAGAVLGEALALWRGNALAGLDSPWLDGQRARLELERAAAAGDLRDIRLRRGEHAALAGELAAQAAESPADERLVGQLMLALYRCGRQADALHWFEQTRRHLAGELGADPGPELRALHLQMLRADPSLAAAPAPASGAATPVPRELPADVPAFTGRVDELAVLDRVLTGAAVAGAGERAGAGPLAAAGGTAGSGAGEGRVAAAVISAVSGTAGVGKTALAVRWGHRAAARFRDGQLYVNLRGYDADRPLTAADALAGFLRALGVPGQDIPPGQDQRAARYRSLLAGRRMLIVLDNASKAEQVRPLLPGTPSCAVLVTSRDSLAGLIARDGATRLDLDLLPLDEAVALLRELIGARADADQHATAELAELCSRLPLALRIAAELAAARPADQLADLVAELAGRQRLDLLDAGDPRTAVRSVFSWSYQHLDHDAALAFRLVGLHPGLDFDAYVIAVLTGGTLGQASRALGMLSRAHVIQPVGPDRYGMHDLLRAYARDLASTDGAGEKQDALTRVFDYYLAAAAAAMDLLYPAERDRRPRIAPSSFPAPLVTDAAAATAWLDAERANLVAIARYAADNGWPAHVTRLSAMLWRYLGAGGFYPEALAIHSHARDAAGRAGDHAAEAMAVNSLGTVYRMLADYDQAAACMERALALFRQAGDRSGEARALHNLGNVYCRQGRYEQAAENLESAATIFRGTGDRLGEALSLDSLGGVRQLQGRYREAGSQLRRALVLHREIGDRDGEAYALHNLGIVCQRQGSYEDAAESLRQALTLFRQAGDRSGEGSALRNLGAVYLEQQHLQRASDCMREALAISREIGHQSGEADALNGLGDVLLATGQPELASSSHTAAIDLACQNGETYQQALAHRGLGNVRLAVGDAAGAGEHWQQALTLFTELGAPEADEIRARMAACAD